VDKFAPSKGRKAVFSRTEPVAPLHDADEIYGIMPDVRSKPYDTHQLLARLLEAL